VYEELLRLEPLLKRDSTDAAHYELVRGALAPLQGDNKSSYVHPTTIELAKGIQQVVADLWPHNAVANEARPYIPVVACTNTQDDPQYELVGGQQPDHVLHGNFCCVQCYGTYQRLELALLQQKREAKTVSPTELIRLQVLEQRVVAKQASSNLTRNNLIAEVGIDVVGEGELVENRASKK
jgi:hypothetical protein